MSVVPSSVEWCPLTTQQYEWQDTLTTSHGHLSLSPTAASSLRCPPAQQAQTLPYHLAAVRF